MSNQETSFLELRIEKSEATVVIPITPEQRDELVKLGMYLMWGKGASSAKFESSEIGQEEAGLRTELLLLHNGPLVRREQKEKRLDGLTRSDRHHLTVQRGELDKRYAELTEHIAALGKDLGRSINTEEQLVWRERKEEKEAERDEIVAKMNDMERQLSRYSGKADRN